MKLILIRLKVSRHYPSAELRNQQSVIYHKLGGDPELFLQTENTMPKAASTLAAAPSTPQARVSKTSVTVRHVRPVSEVIQNPRNGFRQREPTVDKVPEKRMRR